MRVCAKARAKILNTKKKARVVNEKIHKSSHSIENL